MVRRYEVVLPATRTPRRVALAGQPLGEINPAESGSRQTGWRMDSGSQTLHVLFSSGDFDLNVDR